MNKQEVLDNFIIKYNNGINYIYNSYYKDNLSFNDFILQVKSNLINNDSLNKSIAEDEIYSNLFYDLNQLFKVKPSIKEDKLYLCPGCLFLGKNTYAHAYKYFNCKECLKQYSLTEDIKYKSLYKHFCNHALSGYKCPECFRFISKSAIKNNKITCPYLDCSFIGDILALKSLRHPTDKSNISIYASTFKESSLSKDNPNYLNDKAKILLNIIKEQSNELSYSNHNFTLKHKLLVYQAFENLLLKFQDEMISYLYDNSRRGGFQNKIFQEYISLLEKSMPFVIKKNNKVITIDNLLHESLCIFDGISTFTAKTNSKGIINNKTEEFYIGGRKASYTKPYYIGKILDIINSNTNESILNNVVNYTFSKIKVRDIKPNTEVIVTHLRVPPHYQMGGMVYVNRIRQNIINKIYENKN
jgi:hypothetical protein